MVAALSPSGSLVRTTRAPLASLATYRRCIARGCADQSCDLYVSAVRNIDRAIADACRAQAERRGRLSQEEQW